MSDLHVKLSALEVQLAEARAELETAQRTAAETADLHEKLKHTTRARAAQDVVTDLETEIATVRAAIAQAEREQHRARLLEEARALADLAGEYQAALESLVTAVAEAARELFEQAPALIARWRAAREKWLAVFAGLEGAYPAHGGDVESTRRLEALRRTLAEIGEGAEALLRLPPGLQPSNRLERVSHESRNWGYAPPRTPEDVASYVLDAILGNASLTPSQPVPMPDLAPSPGI